MPEHWEQAHGYKPLLANTFSDIEQYEGTCYKVSNWIARGQTKAFERQRIDPPIRPIPHPLPNVVGLASRA